MAAISIVMANYNRARFIGAAIESVQRQTWPDWELLIVDDGSTDQSWVVAEKYACSDSRIRVSRQANAGQAAARNAGVAASTAQLICFLDSDDLWTPGKLRRQVEIMSNASIDVVYGEEDLIDEDGRPVSERKMRRHSGSVWRALLYDNFVTFSTTMVRRSVLEQAGGFDPRIRHADDYDLWLRLSVFARFEYCPELWAFYRVGTQQISRDKVRRFESNQQILQRFMDANPDLVTPSIVRSAWCRFHARRARSLIAGGDRQRALQAAAQALRWNPTVQDGWRALVRVAWSSFQSR